MQNRTQFMLALLVVLLVAFFALDTPELYKNLLSEKKELTEQEEHELFVAQQRHKKEEKSKDEVVDSSAASLQKKIQKQAEVDAMLLAELQSGDYTFEEPFVFIDPYNQSPLSAIALFTTEEPMQISIHIAGDHKNDEINFTFDDFKTEHVIPIYGLYPNRVNEITLTGEYQDGNRNIVEFEVETGDIPQYYKDIVVITKTFREDAYAEGLNFSYEYVNATAFDSYGKWRFLLINYEPSISWGARYSKGQHGFFFTLSKNYILEVNPLGRILNVYFMEKGMHHDLMLTDNDSLIVCTHAENSNQDAIVEMDLTNGSITNTLDYTDILMRFRQYGVPIIGNDWLHMNAILQYNDDLIMSSNYQHLIMKHDWQGNIKWMLSDPCGYLDMYKEYLLTPVGDNFEYSYNQHAPMILPDYDNNPDTIDILLFDNGASRNAVDAELQRQIRANEIVEPSLYSRLVHYRIHEKNMTVEQIWEYGKDKPELFANWRGDADLLPNGNVLGAFNVNTSEPSTKPQGNFEKGVYVEVTPEKDEIWQALVQFKNNRGLQVYRTERMNIYTPNANNLRLGEKAGVFLPEEMLLKD